MLRAITLVCRRLSSSPAIRTTLMQTIEAADQPLTESSTVRIRADVLTPLLEQTGAHERPKPDHRTRQVWHSRLSAWLRLHFTVAKKPSIDRAFTRKGKLSFESCIAAHEREYREAYEARARVFEVTTAHAGESYVAATQHCNTSHAFILQRLISDAQGLGKVVNRKLREGRLNHTEATLVDDEYFVPDDFMRWIEF